MLKCLFLILSCLSFIGFSTYSAHAASPKLCMSAKELNQSLLDFKRRAQVFLTSNPKKIDFELESGTFFNGRSEATSAGLSVHVRGGQCMSSFGNDEFFLLLCHELGHIAGGSPNLSLKGAKMSVEGQADFFALSSCLFNILSADDNSKFLVLKKEPALAAACSGDKKNKQDFATCLRAAAASRNFIQEMTLDSGSKDLPKLGRPDLSVAEQTNFGYPSFQCRLDTFVAGLVCRAKAFADYTREPETPLSCGVPVSEAPRPACWLHYP